MFEQSLGLLLRFSFEHVEALQITDVPELIVHCKEVLEDALNAEKVFVLNETSLPADLCCDLAPEGGGAFARKLHRQLLAQCVRGNGKRENLLDTHLVPVAMVVRN